MQFEEVFERGRMLGLAFGATRVEVVAELGEPEAWTDSSPLILRYGDAQLTFDGSGCLWLVTIWITEDRLRMHSKDTAVNWRVSPDRVEAVFAARGLELHESEHDWILLKARSPKECASACFDEHGQLEKLSLRKL